MGSLPIAQWNAALDQMETALAGATRTLDRAEERWEMAVAPSAGEGESPPALDQLDSRLAEWDARLRAAEGLTRTAEDELTARGHAVARWRALFVQWEELIRQRKGTPPTL